MKDLATPYPFQQTTLYNARQPTIFMIDNGDTIWMWQGWWPKEDPECKYIAYFSLKKKIGRHFKFHLQNIKIFIIKISRINKIIN